MANVTYERRDEIAVLTMDDGKANAINCEMIEEINAFLDRAEGESKAVLIVGREGIFCGGFDLRVIRSKNIELATILELDYMRLYGFPKPVVAAVTVRALLGAFLLLTADYRIGVNGLFRIGVNEVAIGMSLPPFALMLRNRELVRSF